MTILLTFSWDVILHLLGNRYGENCINNIEEEDEEDVDAELSKFTSLIREHINDTADYLEGRIPRIGEILSEDINIELEDLFMMLSNVKHLISVNESTLKKVEESLESDIITIFNLGNVLLDRKDRDTNTVDFMTCLLLKLFGVPVIVGIFISMEFPWNFQKQITILGFTGFWNSKEIL